SGTGTMTFGENIASVTSIKFIDAGTENDVGGSISVTGGLGSKDLTVSFTAPNVTDVIIRADVVDIAGNTATIDTEAYTLDAVVPPSAPTVAPGSLDLPNAQDTGSVNSDNITKLNTPNVTWTAAAGSTSYEVKIGGGARTDVGNVTNYTLPAQADGAHTILVHGKNAGGNGPDATLTVNTDTANPTLDGEVFGSLNTQGLSGTGTMTFGENIASVTSIKFIDAGTENDVGGSISVTGGLGSKDLTVSFTAPNVTDVIIRADVVDIAGNTATIDTEAYTLDAVVPPSAPTVAPGSLDLPNAQDTGSVNSDNITKLNTPNITWTAAAGSTSYEVKIGGGAWTDVGNVTNYTLPAQADGAHTILVHGKNAGGNGPDATLTVNTDTANPNKTGEDLHSLNTQLLSGTGTMTFGENIASVTSIKFIDAGTENDVGGSISVTGGLGSKDLTVSFTAPNVTDVIIRADVVDIAGNTATIDTEAYTLDAVVGAMMMRSLMGAPAKATIVTPTVTTEKVKTTELVTPVVTAEKATPVITPVTPTVTTEKVKTTELVTPVVTSVKEIVSTGTIINS
ncbi:MAG: Ig-like domain-containing protein, partial [Candidatus Gracilibacteria bacterium]|nr:Ig-like domain-containing protein [Candidatus Gracilibacteria bacterium]